MGVPFQTGLAAFAGNGGRSIDEFPAGSVHLFHDSLYMGRPLHGLERHDNGYEFNEHAQEIGFRDGDILKSADGKELTRFNMDMIRSIVEAREVTVLRQGEEKRFCCLS